jgi:hypothetical protein
MADERLRELERRWRETKAREDERAFLRERLRVLARPADQLRLDVLEYDPAAIRAEVTRLLGERVRVLEAARPVLDPAAPPVEEAPARTRPLAAELDALLASRLGSWFEGLGAGFGAERWCHCHSFFGYQVLPRPAGVPQAVDGVMKHLGEIHAFHGKLLAIFDAILLSTGDADTLEKAAREALHRLADLVVVETGCDDAWYAKPRRALELLLDDKDIALPEKRLAEIGEVFSANFRSWLAPTPESVDAVADAVALALVRARFEARYGPS